MPARRPTKSAKPTSHSKAPKRSLSKHDYYEASVQEPEAEIDFMYQAFKALKRPRPVTVREDFCGTAINSIDWVKAGPKNRAIGVDLDAELLRDVATKRIDARLNESQRERITIIPGDVLSDALLTPALKADAVLALNFSYWTFKERAVMVSYFKNVRRALTARGLFILDFFGGSDVLVELQERRRVRKFGGFTYVWDQHRYDPVTGDYLCKIHFEFPGKRGRTPSGKPSRAADLRPPMRSAFTYPWRLWTLPEIRDILIDAGFSRVEVFTEKENKRGVGTGFWKITQSVPADLSFVCYIVAEP
ncbi:MAG: class I SAM-dependent methyltransferase [Phycisphaerales bacterium]|nr:class I SAM-dependent methyltransferase [Phycisphaerales bacterium]